MINILSKLKLTLFFNSGYRCWILLLVIMSLVFCLIHMTPHRTPTIATVDVTSIVRQFIRSQSKLNLPHKTVEQNVKAFGEQLEMTVKTIAQEYHVILMPQEAVIAGALDLTPLVKQRLETTSYQPETLW